MRTTKGKQVKTTRIRATSWKRDRAIADKKYFNLITVTVI